MTARLDFVLDFLSSRQPDIVCVQELKLSDDAFPRLAFEQAGFKALTYGQSQWNGVGVLVRASLDPQPSIVATGLPGHEKMGSRLITVKAAGLSVTSVYIPNGKAISHADFRAKVAWLEGLADYLEQNVDPGSAAVVGGDFNVCPADIDSWNPAGYAGAIFHTEAERKQLARLADLGLLDLFRVKNPDLQVFSWWDYRAGCFHKKQGLRIDLLYGTASVAARVADASVDRDFRKKREGRIPSDHAPVIVEIA